MKNIIYIYSFLCRIWSFIVPLCLIKRINAYKDILYTLWIKRNFKYIGNKVLIGKIDKFSSISIESGTYIGNRTILAVH